MVAVKVIAPRMPRPAVGERLAREARPGGGDRSSEHRADLHDRRRRRTAVSGHAVRQGRQPLPSGRRDDPLPSHPSPTSSATRRPSTAHERGVVHRDVKPATSCSSSARHGASRIPDRLRHHARRRRYHRLHPTGAFIGGVDYAARSGHRRRARADLYSLGCGAYECLAQGQPPFGRRRRVLACGRSATKPIATVRATYPAPAEADEAVLHALARSPISAGRRASPSRSAWRARSPGFRYARAILP